MHIFEAVLGSRNDLYSHLNNNRDQVLLGGNTFIVSVDAGDVKRIIYVTNISEVQVGRVIMLVQSIYRADSNLYTICRSLLAPSDRCVASFLK